MLYFFSSLIISLAISLLIIYFSHKHQIFIDHHETIKPQRFHTDATPRSGGIGIISGLSLFLLSTFGIKLFIPTILAFLSGIFEDFHNSLSAKTRLFLQLIAAVIAIWTLNAYIKYLGFDIYLPIWFSYILTIFAIVGMMNAINIIDGFNGLASGIIILILISFGYIAYTQNNHEILNIICITLGSTIGFVLLNFPKGKIFLGDGGAYMLGFVVITIGIFLSNKYNSVSPWYIVAVSIYPIWEVAFSIIRKLSQKKSPMQPDSYHFHMLVHRVITKNNPLTALFIITLNIPFVYFATIYAHNSLYNIKLILVFIAVYISLYFFMLNRDKKLTS